MRRVLVLRFPLWERTQTGCRTKRLNAFCKARITPSLPYWPCRVRRKIRAAGGSASRALSLPDAHSCYRNTFRVARTSGTAKKALTFCAPFPDPV